MKIISFVKRDEDPSVELVKYDCTYSLEDIPNKEFTIQVSATLSHHFATQMETSEVLEAVRKDIESVALDGSAAPDGFKIHFSSATFQTVYVV